MTFQMLTIKSMKKIIILILIVVSPGIFAQEGPARFNIKSDEINNSNVGSDIAFLEDSKLVSASSMKHFSYDRDVYSSKTFRDLRTGKIAKDKRVLIKKNFIENNMKTVFFSVNRKIKMVKSINGDVIETKRAVNLQLFKARVNENGEWADLEMLPFNSNRHSTGQPYLNADDTKLYFVSDGPESLGRTDIFVVDINDDGTYGNPVNLGPKINSSEREIYPFIDKDNVLYFSSDAQNKKGNLDVFVSKIFDNTIATSVKLQGLTDIGKSDFTYVIAENVDLNTFSTNEKPGKGVEEIYTSIDATDINFDCNQEISGIVKNQDTQELLSNVKITLYDENEAVVSSFMSNDSDASFSFKQACNTSYTLKGSLDGYLIGELAIQTVNDLNASPIEVVMNMSANQSKEEIMLTDTALEVTENKSQGAMSIENAMSGSNYNFSSDQEVYTVQIGAFNGNAETDKYIELSSLFNYQYNDGLNRYYSGVFGSRKEAMNYLNLLKMNGFKDAYVVGLRGEKRF
jgi:hypothetical protein